MSDTETPSVINVPSANTPPPKPLVFDDNVATGWKTWKKAWDRFEIATGVRKQDGVFRVSTFLKHCDILFLGIQRSNDEVSDDVFEGTLGKIPETYKIIVNDTVQPVVQYLHGIYQ